MSRSHASSSAAGGAADEPWRSILGADPEGGRLHLDERSGAVRISGPLAYNLLKRGISSKAIGPVGEFLGVGKAEVADMLDIDRGTYYGLGGAGSRLWTLLAQPRTLDELVQLMCADFAVDEPACRADVLAFLKDLIGHGLAEAQPA